jgi:antitoxin (DNA-binding transcriptional repressor) of toxin-antitoxin stability system
MLKTVSETTFLSDCRAFMDAVAEAGDTLLITRDGRPMLEIRPAETQDDVRKSLFGGLHGTLSIRGDIISPVEEDWQQSEERKPASQ